MNNFNVLEPILIIFAHSISGICATNQNYIFTEPSMNLLYLALSHSASITCRHYVICCTERDRQNR